MPAAGVAVLVLWAQAQQSRCIGLIASWHVQSSWPRDQTHVPCIGRQVLNYWTTGKFLFYFLTRELFVLYYLSFGAPVFLVFRAIYTRMNDYGIIETV